MLEIIRATDKRVPVIKLTQEDEEPKIIEAIEKGAAGYILKPFSERTIADKIKHALRQHD